MPTYRYRGKSPYIDVYHNLTVQPGEIVKTRFILHTKSPDFELIDPDNPPPVYPHSKQLQLSKVEEIDVSDFSKVQIHLENLNSKVIIKLDPNQDDGIMLDVNTPVWRTDSFESTKLYVVPLEGQPEIRVYRGFWPESYGKAEEVATDSGSGTTSSEGDNDTSGETGSACYINTDEYYKLGDENRVCLAVRKTTDTTYLSSNWLGSVYITNWTNTREFSAGLKPTIVPLLTTATVYLPSKLYTIWTPIVTPFGIGTGFRLLNTYYVTEDIFTDSDMIEQATLNSSVAASNLSILLNYTKSVDVSEQSEVSRVEVLTRTNTSPLLPLNYTESQTVNVAGSVNQVEAETSEFSSGLIEGLLYTSSTDQVVESEPSSSNYTTNTVNLSNIGILQYEGGS